jgi:hypothetical protein
LQSKLWENDEMTEEEAEEVMKKAELLKIKMVRASERMKQWGMETGLNRSAKRDARTHARTHASMRTKAWHSIPVNTYVEGYHAFMYIARALRDQYISYVCSVCTCARVGVRVCAWPCAVCVSVARQVGVVPGAHAALARVCRSRKTYVLNNDDNT